MAQAMNRSEFRNNVPTEHVVGGALAQITALAGELGFAPVGLGKLAEGGMLVQARGNQGAELIFQDVFKKDL